MSAEAPTTSSLSDANQRHIHDSKAVLDTKFAQDSAKATPQDFLTLTKPGVLMLVVYTAAIGIVLAPGAINPFLALVAIFAISLGSAGAAAFNMWYDRDIDLVMNRTQKRPIPQNRIAPRDALTFAWLLSITSVVILYMATNAKAAALLAFSIFFYAVVYTMWLKRNTPQNIVIGGAAGAFPPVIGWAAATGSLWDPLPWALFAIIFIWTPSHFWALAVHKHQDYKDAKIPMMPITAGLESTKTQILVYAVLLVGLSFIIPHIFSSGWIYVGTAAILGMMYIHLSLKLKRSDHTAPGMKLFGFSILYLFLVFTSLVIDYYIYG